MQSPLHSKILIVILTAASVTAQSVRTPRPSALASSFQDFQKSLTLASFNGTSQDSIQAAATDSNGNIYVAGTTFSAQFPVKNAQQAAFGDTSVLRTTNLGASWTRLTNPPGGASTISPDPVTPQVLFASGPKGIFKSSDAGQTWQLAYAVSQANAAGPLAIDPANHLHIAALAPQSVLRSLDGGVTWTVNAGAVCGAPCNLIADPTGSGTLVAVGIGQAFISRDWGATFKGFGPPGVGFPSAAAFDPSHPGWIYVDKSAGVTGTLYLTTDFGATWSQKASPSTTFSSIVSLAVDPDQPNVIVAAALTAIYESSDGAASWTVKSQSPSTAPTYFSPESTIPFALVPSACTPGGGLFAAGAAAAAAGSFAAAFSLDFGATWQTPQLSHVSSVVAGPGCAFFATRTLTSDTFVAKIAPDGAVLWATYLGGADQDAAVALAVNAQGDVYVTGNTSSPDFPSTVGHIGVRGENAVFLTMYSPNGSMIYSVTLGGEAANTAVALATDAGQNVYLAGKTNSLQFPVTPGTIVSGLQQGSYTGFLLKLSSAVTLTYSTYLGPSYTYPGAMIVDASGDVTVAGSGIVPGTETSPSQSQPTEYVMKLDATASQVLESAYLPGAVSGTVSGLATDSGNDLIVFGQTVTQTVQSTPAAFSSQPIVPCESNNELSINNDSYVTKLSAIDWQPVYTAVFRASCGVNSGAMGLEPNGDIVLAFGASAGLPLSGPLLAGPACTSGSAVAKLSADGTTLEYATYLPGCGVPAMALAHDGSVCAGATALPGADGASVLHVTTASSDPIELNQIFNAFSGDASALVGGGLYTLGIGGFQPPSSNLGLNPSANLPDELNGVQVLFDGVPGAMLSTGTGTVIAAAPPVLPVGFDTRAGTPNGSTGANRFARVQVLFNGVSSNPVWMPILSVRPGLLTTDYLNAMPHPASTFPDAFARNQDGTQNSPSNPAPIGSTIMLYAIGLGSTAPLADPGIIASYTTGPPATPFYSFWAQPIPAPAPLVMFQVPGFISSVFQIQVPIPANRTFNGTNVGNGVQRVTFALLLFVPLGDLPQPVSNVVNVYLK